MPLEWNPATGQKFTQAETDAIASRRTQIGNAVGFLGEARSKGPWQGRLGVQAGIGAMDPSVTAALASRGSAQTPLTQAPQIKQRRKRVFQPVKRYPGATFTGLL